MIEMKRQLIKVKNQLALGRAEKTNELPEDVTRADAKSEYMKNTCQIVAKKMPACLLMPPGGTDSAPGKDRKDKSSVLKKMPETALANALLESFDNYSGESQLKKTVEACVRAENEIASIRYDTDHEIDMSVYAKFNTLLDKEVPALTKLKRSVQKQRADRDAAKQRHHQAESRNSMAASKMEVIRDELDDCESRLEQSEDALACELFQFIAKEGDLCHNLLHFYKHRRECYQRSLEEMNKLIPQMETIVNDTVRKIFGTQLKNHLEMERRRIAYPIELCACCLYKDSMGEEGLFRLAGGASKLKRMKLSFDAGCMTPDAAITQDPHVIAGCLKSYLRDLPEPLLTFALYDRWIEVAKTTIEDKRLELLKSVVNALPKENFDNLEYLIRFFHILAANQEANKMSPQNIAIVIAPNLIWMHQDNANVCLNALNATGYHSRIVELLIIHRDVLFPGEARLFVTLQPDVFYNGDFNGIDNRGYEAKERDEGVISRSYSEEELGGSPRPAARKNKKPVAPPPPEQQRERPPRPAGPAPIPAAAATLPRRPKVQKETKATETEDNMMTQSMGSYDFKKKAGEATPRDRIEEKPKTTVTKESQTTEDFIAETKLEEGKQNAREAVKQDIKEAKEKFFLGEGGKPALPDRPAIPAKPALRPANRNALPSGDNAKYENVSMSSNENLSGDERTLQHTKVYSTDAKQTPTYIQVDKKRDRSQDKGGKDKDHLTEGKNGEAEVEEVQLRNAPRERNVTLLRTLSDSRRPTSLSVTGASDRPERPPKPEQYKTSPSHCRASSDGKIVDGPVPARRDVFATDGAKNVIKHPSTSPPPPPVAVKARAQSQGDSTDF